MNKYIIISLFLFQLFFLKVLYSKEDFILIQSTTSTRDSGFYDFILSKYKEVSNVNIKVVASGTGHAIQNAKKCDADIILVHDKSSEELFVRNGFGLYRKDLMYNDFLLVGPKILKNKIQNNDIYEAFKEIYKKKKFFNTYMIPIIQEFMKIYEASLVIDIDSKAFRLVIFDSRINITNSVIERMNSLYINIDEITQEITS